MTVRMFGTIEAAIIRHAVHEEQLMQEVEDRLLGKECSMRSGIAGAFLFLAQPMSGWPNRLVVSVTPGRWAASLSEISKLVAKHDLDHFVWADCHVQWTHSGRSVTERQHHQWVGAIVAC